MVFVTNEGLFGPFCSKKRRRKSWASDDWGSDDDSWSDSGVNEPWGSDDWGSDNWGSDWNNDFFGDNEIDAIFTSNTAVGMKFSFDFDFEFDMVFDYHDYGSNKVTASSEPAKTTQVIPSESPVVTQSSTTKKTTISTTKATTRPVTRPTQTYPPVPRDECIWADRNVFSVAGDCSSRYGSCNLKHFEKCGKSILERLPDVCRYNDAEQVMPQVVEKLWPLGVEFESFFKTKCNGFGTIRSAQVTFVTFEIFQT